MCEQTTQPEGLMGDATERQKALSVALPLRQQAEQQILSQFGASQWQALLADLPALVAIARV
jgi:hypothetical protein